MRSLPLIEHAKYAALPEILTAPRAETLIVDLMQIPLPDALRVGALEHGNDIGSDSEWLNNAAWARAWRNWVEEVQIRVSASRFQHVLRVAHLAASIAYAAGLDTRRAYAAGILHDIARDLSEEELTRLAPPECQQDNLFPLALHGRAARVLLEQLGFEDAAVLTAIENHVTGPYPEDLLSACVYVADVSEPGRKVNQDIRELAFDNLPLALCKAIESKVCYLQGRGIEVHPHTLRLHEHICCAYAGHLGNS